MDTSRIYHQVRGQATIKLYVIYNCLSVWCFSLGAYLVPIVGHLQIFDRLCCSFGQDILDSLYLSVSRSVRRDGSSLLPPFTNFFISCLYVVIHAMVLCGMVTTLNVAFNSYNNSLVTLLVSNQVRVASCALHWT